MKERVRELKKQGDQLFSKRGSFMSLCQTNAENFYPMRADFTSEHNLGDEFASHLMTGRPLLAHRDLTNAISTMLRPRGQTWFHAGTGDERINEDTTAKKWLDDKTEVMRKLMYDPRASFIRSTKEGDADFTAFGQAVIEENTNRMFNGLLFRTHHIRDVSWVENAELKIDTVHRNWKVQARELVKLFPKTVSKHVEDLIKESPHKEIKCRHIVIPSDEYDPMEKQKGSKQHPFMSIYIDCEHDELLEETPIPGFPYIIPRWVTVSGSQYAHSPATVIGLADARMLQDITLTLLEAGQKVVDPPRKAVSEMIVGGVNIHAGGITWVDSEHDEKRSGKALELLESPSLGLGWGNAREQKIEELIGEAFFLNKIALPPAAISGDMTKWESQQRVEEYIRGALPLFEPMEVEYNNALCVRTWELAMLNGAFGSLEDMPDILKGQDLQFTFESPLQEASSRAKSQAFMEASELLATAAELDPGVRHVLDTDKGVRDALTGVGVPADWIVDEDIANENRQAEQQQAQIREAMEIVGQGADVAGKVGQAVNGG